MTNLSNKIRNAGLALVLAAGTAGLIGCGDDCGCNPQDFKPVEINIGTFKRIGDSCMIYAGMNSELTFSLANCGYSGANVYYPKSSEIIDYQDYKFRVISVTPEKIVLQELKDK